VVRLLQLIDNTSKRGNGKWGWDLKWELGLPCGYESLTVPMCIVEMVEVT
jgi:hypothetical protein